MADEEYTERLGGKGPSPAYQLSTAVRDREIIADATRGMTTTEMAKKHKLSDRQLRRILKDFASAVRAETTERVEQSYALQCERLERMYAIVDNYLRMMEESFLPGGVPVPFDDKPFRVAVLICERQAKLMGFDKGASNSEKGKGWLDGAPIEEVVAYAKQLRMNVPTQFDTGP